MDFWSWRSFPFGAFGFYYVDEAVVPKGPAPLPTRKEWQPFPYPLHTSAPLLFRTSNLETHYGDLRPEACEPQVHWSELMGLPSCSPTLGMLAAEPVLPLT